MAGIRELGDITKNMEDKNDKLKHLVKSAIDIYSNDYHIVVIPKFLSKQFIGFNSINEDLKYALEYLKIIRQTENPHIKSALMYSAIALYGRCYTNAIKSSSSNLDAKDIFKDNQCEFFQIHETIMHLRHEFISHRGDTDSEVSIAYFLFHKHDKNMQGQIRFNRLKQYAFIEKELVDFETLILFTIKKVELKIQKNVDKINNAFFEKYTTDEISLMIANNLQI